MSVISRLQRGSPRAAAAGPRRDCAALQNVAPELAARQAKRRYV